MSKPIEINSAETVEPVEFDKKAAVDESATFLKDLLLKNPDTQNDMFVATDVTMNEDGSVSIICIEDIDAEKAVMHTIFSGYVEKNSSAEVVEEDDKESIISSPTSGKIVGLDGQPIG